MQICQVTRYLNAYLHACSVSDAIEAAQEEHKAELVEKTRDNAADWLKARRAYFTRQTVAQPCGLHQTDDLFAELCTDDASLLAVDDVLCLLLTGKVDEAKKELDELFEGLAEQIVQRKWE